MAIRLRQEALKRYYENPKLCKECHCVIPIPEGAKVHQIRQKIFCGHSCSASASNKRRAQPKFCRCGAKISWRQTKCSNCPKLRSEKTLSRVKGEIRKSQLSEHARRVVPKKPCEACGYDKFTEVCHIKPIEDFLDSSRLRDINSPMNLIRLCPNCHWELDHGMLSINRNCGVQEPGSCFGP